MMHTYPLEIHAHTCLWITAETGLKGRTFRANILNRRGSTLLELLYQALSQDRGLVVQAEDCDVEELRQRLYRERTKAQDPALEVLSFVISPTDPTQIWIVRKDANS